MSYFVPSTPDDICNSFEQSLEVQRRILVDGQFDVPDFLDRNSGNATFAIEDEELAELVYLDKPDGYGNMVTYIGTITNSLLLAPHLYKSYLLKESEIVNFLFVGMNPAPTSNTGIPFNEDVWQDNRKIEPISGSARRFWMLMDSELDGDTERFDEQCHVMNYCSLICKDEYGRNVNPDQIARYGSQFFQDLLAIFDKSMRERISSTNPTQIIAFGRFAEQSLKKYCEADSLYIRHPSPKADPDKRVDMETRDRMWVQDASAKLNKLWSWKSMIKETTYY